MYRLTLIISAFLLLNHQPVFSQTQLNDCANLGVETGAFQAWQGIYGAWVADLISDTIAILSENYGLDPGRHRIRHVSEGNVPEVTDEAIPFVPPGSEYAIQLGNSINGAQYDRLVTSFRVDSGNTLFQYQFAVIFEDPDHTPIEQPKFELRVSDQQGNTLPCGFYQVTAAGNISGFKSQGNIRYRNWTTAGVDLRDYVGQIVTLQITTYDCSQGGHWGMALFDASCFAAVITPVNFCPGIDSVLTMEAPEGFQNYQWSNGANSRVITVQNPVVGEEFSVEFSPYSTLSDSCRLFLSFDVPAYVDVLPNQYISYCGNSSTFITPSLVGDDFHYLWHPSGDTAKVTEVHAPGLYTVEVSKAGGCALFDTILVESIPEPLLTLEFEPPSCDGHNDGTITAVVDANEPVAYYWNTQETGAALTGLPSGVFTVTVTGQHTGCSATAAQQLEQADSVKARAELLRQPLCENWPSGEACVIAGAGTPPYAYSWSTGAQQSVTPLYAGGMSVVTVTDSKGCQAVDTLWVDPLHAATETTGNICHDGEAGSITVNAFGGVAPYLYELGDDGFFQSEALFEELPTGLYKIRVQDNSGCIRSFPAEVKNLRLQPFVVQLPSDTTILVGEYLDIPMTHNYPLQTFEWSAACVGEESADEPMLTLHPFDDCSVSIQALDTFGCPAEASMRVRVLKDYDLYIPNVFMPRGGHDNSQFYASVYLQQLKTVHSFQIFDRWGGLVFEDFDYQPNLVERGWDGTIDGREAPGGVYVYKIDIEFVDGFRRMFAGDVTLIR